MITACLEDAGLYRDLRADLVSALAYLKTADLLGIQPGRYPIHGDRVFALFQDYQTKPEADGLLEAHRKFIDVQYVARGSERMGYAPVQHLQERSYTADRDLVILEGRCDFFTLSAGCFAIFFPSDAHMPGIQVGSAESVRKIVIKVAV